MTPTPESPPTPAAVTRAHWAHWLRRVIAEAERKGQVDVRVSTAGARELADALNGP